MSTRLSAGRAIAYGNFRRLDRSAKRGVERPSLHNKRLIVERRSLHSGLRPSVETTGVAICDCLASKGLTRILSMLIIVLLIVFVLPARERWPLISPTIS